MRGKFLKSSLSNVIKAGVAQEALNTLACGPILVAYALMFGASPIIIGFLGSLEFFGWFSHFFSSYLLNKGKSVKFVSVYYAAISRVFYLFAALLAFFHDSTWGIWLLVFCFFSNYLIGGVVGGAFYPWMKSLIPKKFLGSFFAQRYRLMMFANLICYAFAAGIIFLFENYFPDKVIYGYSILLMIAFFIGLYSVYVLNEVQDVTLERLNGESFLKKCLFSLKNKSFLLLSSFLGVLNFTTGFVTPFFTVFMLKKVGIGMPFVVVLTILSQISYILSTKFWSKFVNQKGCLETLSLSSFLYILSILFFVGTEYYPILFLIFGHIILGIARLGVKLATNNLSLLYVPVKDSFIYLSIVNFIRAFGSSVSGILSGLTLTILSVFALSSVEIWNIFWFIGIVFFLITFCLSKKMKGYVEC